MIHDRDPRFTLAFRETLAAADVQVVRLPPRSPNLNAFAERFVRTIKESCLDRIILVGEASLRRALAEFVEHYHHERNHQGLGDRLIVPLAEQTNGDGRIGVSRAARRLVEVLSPTRRVRAAAALCELCLTFSTRLNVTGSVRTFSDALRQRPSSSPLIPSTGRTGGA